MSNNQGAATGENALMTHKDPETQDSSYKDTEIQNEKSVLAITNKPANQGTDLEEESKADSEVIEETLIN